MTFFRVIGALTSSEWVLLGRWYAHCISRVEDDAKISIKVLGKIDPGFGDLYNSSEQQRDRAILFREPPLRTVLSTRQSFGFY
jgi:hypothetical protein